MKSLGHLTATRILVPLIVLFLLVGSPAGALNPQLAAAGGQAGALTLLSPSSPSSVEKSLADADLTFRGEDGGDWAGYSVAPAGDVNNDGFDDILVGAPWAGPGEEKGVGKAYLILGRPRHEWPSDHIDLSLADASFIGPELDLPLPGMTGRQNYTAGDVNGDGYDDFLITCWKYSPPYTIGKAYLFLGRPNIEWGHDYPVEQADASFVGEDDRDHGGWYVSTAGDVNADSYDDFLITATGDEDGGGHQAGQVYLFLGRPEIDWGLDGSLAQADASFVGEAKDDRAGRSAASVGDVNADGYDDFLIGAIGNNEGGPDAGQSYLILGREAAGWGMDYDLALADASFIGENPGDESGRRVEEAGDVNGDGYDDFLIGASRHDAAGSDAGKAYLVLGRAAADWGMDYELAQADASFLGEDENDQAGRRVSGAGDFNHDGYDDFLICAPHNGRAGENAGTAYLFYGRPDPDWGTNFPVDQADILYLGEAPNDRGGYDLAPAGDMDADGVDDFLTCGYRGDENGLQAGQAYVLYGGDGPQPVAFLPDAPDGRVGEWHSFRGEYQDPSGWDDIVKAQMVLGRSANDRRGFTVQARVSNDAFYLRDLASAGWLGPCSPGDAVVLSNGAVELDCELSSIDNDGEQMLQVTLEGRWVRQVGSPKEFNAYLRASDRARNDSGFVEMGTWTLLPGEK